MTSNVTPPTTQKKLRMLSRSFQSATVIGVAGMPRRQTLLVRALDVARADAHRPERGVPRAALEDLELTARRVAGDEPDGFARRRAAPSSLPS